MPPGVGYPSMGMGMGGGMGPSSRPPMGATAPVMGRPNTQGMEMRAAALVDIAMKLLSQAVMHAGANTPQGLAIVKTLEGLGKAYPAPVSNDISQAEMKLMASRTNPAPLPNPGQDASALLSRIGGGSPQTAGAAA